MSAIYTWPGWSPNMFEMHVAPNFVTFTSPYTKATQTVDFLGERWAVKLTLPAGTDPVVSAAQEAFFDRLRGPVNFIALWNLRRPVPQGTLRGTPVTSGAALQLANLVSIQATPGATLRAGDQLGINGQLCRVMADAVASGTGLISNVEVLPRLRAAVPSGSAVVWQRPTALFMLAAAGVPVVYRPGMNDGSSLDLTEKV